MILEDYMYVMWTTDDVNWSEPRRLSQEHKFEILDSIERDAFGKEFIAIRTGLSKKASIPRDYDLRRGDFHNFMYHYECRKKLWNWLTEWRKM